MIKPLAKTRLSIDRFHVLGIVVWKTHKDMLSGIKKYGKFGRNTYGLCCIRRLRLSPRGKVLTKYVAEIHLVHRRFGAGVFAHELQHFLVSWYDAMRWDVTGKHWEKSAYLAGDLTHDFWDWFYNRNLGIPG